MEVKEIIDFVKSLQNEEDKINFINELSQSLNEINPINEPVGAVLWVKSDRVKANDYNPNKVAPPEMELLRLSIQQDGYTQPIVCYYDKENDQYIVVDGFHRNRVGKEDIEIRERIKGYLPIVIIDKNINDRMASTIRHNRARGTHGIISMSKLVAEMYFNGWSDKKIAEQLGMEKDEVLRLKQFTGLGDLFKDRDYSKAWE